MKKTLKQIQKKNQGFQIKTDFNLVDKGDFPDLIKEKKKEVKRQEKFKEVIEDVKDKPATYQKKINEMFPSLGSEPEPRPAPKKEEALPKPPNKEEAWWQKINQGKKIEID